MTDKEPTPTTMSGDVTVLGAARRYLWLVVAIVTLFAIASVLFARARPDSFTAEAVIILEDPAATDVLGLQVNQSRDRLVSNQLEVLRSGVVARGAAATVQALGFEIDAGDIEENTVFTTSRDSDQITITFSDESADGAIQATQAILDAYREVQLEQRRAEGIRVLERLTSARQVLLGDFEELERQIDELRSERDLDGLVLAALDRLSGVQTTLNATSDPDTIALLSAQIVEIRNQIQTLELAIELEQSDAEVAALIRSRDQIRLQLDSLAQRAAELEIQSETAASGIAFEDPPALIADGGGVGTVFTLAAGAFLGILVALGVAYALAGRRQTYAGRFEPQTITGLQLLGDIPLLEEGVPLPVRDDPRSPGAEAIRFAVGNLQLALDRTESNTVMFVSTGVGEGKSTVLANVAIAAARSGARVLVIDADFGNQQTSALLLGGIPDGPGLTEIGIGRTTLSEAVLSGDAGMGVTIDVLSRGSLPVLAPEFFASRSLPAIVDRITSVYDLVLIDGPPLLQVAYANNVAQMAKAVIPVISHGAGIGKTVELVDRLRFMSVDVLGYIYNMAPLRIEFLESGGSMRDVLGDRGHGADVGRRGG